MIALDTKPCEETAQPKQKIWTVGTLTYTTAGLFTLFLWLLWGDCAWSFRDRSVGPVSQLLFKKFDASDELTGFLLGTLPGLISMLLGPVISYKSDRLRSRWGRRIPFLMVTTPLIAIAIIGLGFSPAIAHLLQGAFGLKSLGYNQLTLLILGAFWTLFEVASITANSVFGGLINDVVPQAVVGRFYGMFRAVSLTAGMIFNYWFIGKAETYYAVIFGVIGTLYGVGLLSMCLKVKEGGYPAVAYADEPRTGFVEKVKCYFRECYSKPYYICMFVGGSLFWMAIGTVNLYIIFFVKSMGMSMDTYGKCITLTFLVSFCLSYPLGSIADRFHPLRVALVIQALYTVALLWGGLYATNITNFKVALFAHVILSGSYMTASASLGQRLLPKAKFTQFGSAGALLGCIGGMMLSPLIGRYLDSTNHNYRYSYLVSFWLSFAGFILFLNLHRMFMKLGGPKHYVAPE